MIALTQTGAVKVQFFLDNRRFALRHLITIPRINEEVRFNDVIYKVLHIIHIYDEQDLRVAISIQKIQQRHQNRRK